MILSKPIENPHAGTLMLAYFSTILSYLPPAPIAQVTFLFKIFSIRIDLQIPAASFPWRD